MTREILRKTFGEDAALYDKARPGYPARLFTDLAAMTGLGPGARVLEIGCGTGQATLPLARLGCSVLAVELSPALAAVARRKLAAFPRVSVEVAAFEEWTPPAEPFDLVVAATSFHWLDPATRAAQAADRLRPGGALAVIYSEHVRGGTVDFFHDAQAYYERYDPATPPGLRLTPGDQIPDDAEEFDRSGRFTAAEFRRYEWEQSYSTAGYLDLLMTYSGHRALPAADREGLLTALASLIDNDHGGHITKRYLTRMTVVRTPPAPSSR
ncbi:class I SAM-dependent methyltransferase [Actinoplanes sp. CA-030573]|uniref:class I SAM-dependent methyltransferase n=1 Tax=Actinoplanes sp. CA-030573 TaxID=3239898 RepID=UPI003D8FEFE6